MTDRSAITKASVLKPVELEPGVFVSRQVRLEDMQAPEGFSFRTLVNNRPDGEQDGQPLSQELENIAVAIGAAYFHVPVIPGQWAEDSIGAFEAVLANSERPFLAFCRSGMRAASLWALARVGELTTDAIIERAKSAGFDLEPIRSLLSEKEAEALQR